MQIRQNNLEIQVFPQNEMQGYRDRAFDRVVNLSRIAMIAAGGLCVCTRLENDDLRVAGQTGLLLGLAVYVVDIAVDSLNDFGRIMRDIARA